MDFSSFKHLSKEEIENHYKGYLKQLESKILDASVNTAVCPKDAPEYEGFCKVLIAGKNQLASLEQNYADWKVYCDSTNETVEKSDETEV